MRYRIIAISQRYLIPSYDTSIFFIALAISFKSYAITNNVAYDIALRYRMRYPYDAISFISHAISLCDIVCDIVILSCAIHLLSHTISQCDIACDIPMMQYLLYRKDIALRYRKRYICYRIRYRNAISHAIIAISL